MYLKAAIRPDKLYSFSTLEILLQFRHPHSVRTTSSFFRLVWRARQDAGTAILYWSSAGAGSAEWATLDFGTPMEKETSDSARHNIISDEG